MKLNAAQQEAVDFYEGCCSVMAAAGSGKTRTLVERIAKLIQAHNVDPNNILAITFSKKAALTMQERLTDLLGEEQAEQIHVKTFHGFGYYIIKTYDTFHYTLLTQEWQQRKIIDDIIDKKCEEEGREREDYPSTSVILEELSYIKNKGERYKGHQHEFFFRAYENYKKKHFMLDFDDMLVRAVWILENNPAALNACQETYRFILADEMQDTNAVQYHLLELIASKYKNLFIVGDMMQSIYGFRASDNSFMKDFDSRWPGAKVIHLDTNYRSTNTLVEFANHFAVNVPESHHKHYVPVKAAKSDGLEPILWGFPYGIGEVEAITEQVKKYHEKGYEYKDMAILCRVNEKLLMYEYYFANEFIPYDMVGSVGFSERAEIKLLINYLRLINNTTDDDAFRYIYCRPNRWLGKVFLDKLTAAATKNKKSLFDAMEYIKDSKFRRGIKEIQNVVQTMRKEKKKPVNEIMTSLREYLDLDDYITRQLCDDIDNDRIANMDRFIKISEGLTLQDFLTRVQEVRTTKNENGVHLMSIHKSKGLEFKIVFIVGVDDITFPHPRNLVEGEEMRLMYVAITRAEEILHISFSGISKFTDMLES